jgi:hypothetical protein
MVDLHQSWKQPDHPIVYYQLVLEFYPEHYKMYLRHEQVVQERWYFFKFEVYCRMMPNRI